MPKQMESYWQLLEPLFSEIDFHDGPKRFAATILDVPRPCIHLFAAHMCLAEVHNGGLLQLFWNNTGLLVPEGVEGFDAIGMPQMAALLREAALPLGSPYPRERNDRWDALLKASGRSAKELKQIFKNEANFYLAFEKATKSLPFEALERQLWRTAETENGGFQRAADRYAQNQHLAH
jgi:hypothetical protein